MIGMTAVLLVVLAVVVAFATHHPTRTGASALGNKVQEHLYGPQHLYDTAPPLSDGPAGDVPAVDGGPQPKTLPDPDDGFDYSIYTTE